MSLRDRLRGAWAAVRGKAMVDLHPEVLERVHLISLRPEEIQSWAPYSYLTAADDYERHTWVHKAVKVISDNLSTLPLSVKRDGKPLDGHALLALFASVNDTLSSGDLWQQWTTDMLLGGESGFELIRNGRGAYLEVWPRQPHTIYLKPDAARRRYFKVAEYRLDDGTHEPWTLPPEEFIHFKFYNPRNPWRGLSPIAAVRMGILIDQYAQAWSWMFFRKGARPDYAVIAPSGVTATERENLEIMLEQKFGGVGRAHRPIVLEQGVTDVKPLDFRPKDMEWLSQREFSRDEIAAIFGVPDEIMGFGKDTYENFDTAHRVLWTLTIRPLARYRDTALTEFFRRVGQLKDNEAIESDFSGVSALQPDFGAQVTQATALFNMGVPFNTIDERLRLGIGPIPGGERGYLPLVLVPLFAPRPTGPQAEAARSKGVEFGSAEHERLWQAFVKRTRSDEERLGAVVAGLFRRQQDEVVARLESGGKARKGAGDVADDPFDRGEWEGEFGEAARPELQRIVKRAGQMALDDLLGGVGVAFDVLDPRVVAFLSAREQRFAQSVNETTWQTLRDSLNAGIEDGETIRQLAERVEQVMGDRIRSSGETIARTEVIGASNGGTLEAWRQSEVVEGKSWLSALDERVRPTHVEAHGQTVGLDDDFQVGAGNGPAPGQIGLAEEDINCRCTLTAVVSERAVRRALTAQRDVAQLISGNGEGHQLPLYVEGSGERMARPISGNGHGRPVVLAEQGIE